MTENESEILFRELQTTFRRLKHLRMMPAAPSETFKNVTPGEVHLMHAIIKRAQAGEKIRPADLAESRHMTPQALSPMLRKLEEAGFITRRMSNTDRRVSYIEPTDKGISLSEKLDQMFESQMRDLVEYLGEEDVKNLITILHKIGEYSDERRDLFMGHAGCSSGHHCADTSKEGDVSIGDASVEGKEEVN